MEMVRLGFAHSYAYEPNVKYTNIFETAEQEALASCGCIWQPCNGPGSPLYIGCLDVPVGSFHPNAEGNDNENLNDEYVTIHNACDYAVDMSDWGIADNSASNRYRFPNFAVQPGSSFTLYSGSGANTPTKLYWGRTDKAVWNNDEDTLYLRDSAGNLVLVKEY